MYYTLLIYIPVSKNPDVEMSYVIDEGDFFPDSNYHTNW